MTKFSDQLFDDLMREHGTTLAHTRAPVPPRRHITARRTLLAAGGGLAAAAIAGGVVTGGQAPAGSMPPTGSRPAPGGNPGYAVTKNPDGTITLAVYSKSGIAGANARLRQLGDNQVVVVPVRPGCPSLRSLPGARPPSGLTMMEKSSRGGTITVTAKGIPAGYILVVGAKAMGDGRVSGAVIIKPPAPSCVSLRTQKAARARG